MRRVRRLSVQITVKSVINIQLKHLVQIRVQILRIHRSNSSELILLTRVVEYRSSSIPEPKLS